MTILGQNDQKWPFIRENENFSFSKVKIRFLSENSHFQKFSLLKIP